MFVPILAYHKVQDEFELGISYTTPRQFERQIAYLRENGYRSISVDEYVRGENLHPKSVILTFDDAYESIYENAFPILSKHGFTATIFVITKFVGQLNRWDYHAERFQFTHCTWPQLQFLATQGWEIGSHTVDHANLRSLSSRRIWHELRYSRDVIEHHVQEKVNVISYPYGWYSAQIIEMAKSAGYRAGCTLGYTSDRRSAAQFALARRGVYVLEPFALFKHKLGNDPLSRFDDVKQKFFSLITRSTTRVRASRSAQNSS